MAELEGQMLKRLLLLLEGGGRRERQVVHALLEGEELIQRAREVLWLVT